MNANDPGKKIIIDEDWKTQVEREREALRAEDDNSPAPPETSSNPSLDEAYSEDQLPPASFEFLLSTLVTQSLMGLGQIPDPVTRKAEIHLGYARHQIDLLAMLQEKTRGNLSEEESLALDQSLHQLRMIFVGVQKKG